CTPGSGAIPNIMRPKPNAPAGVVRSPSCLRVDTPRWPSHAHHGPATARQQAPDLLHSLSAPCVEPRPAATTVISCVAERVEASWLASVAGQPDAPARSPNAEALAAATASAMSAE